MVLKKYHFSELSPQPKLFHTSTIFQYRDRQQRGVFDDEDDFEDGLERGRRNFPDREQNFRRRPERNYDDYGSLGRRQYHDREPNLRQRNDQSSNQM